MMAGKIWYFAHHLSVKHFGMEEKLKKSARGMIGNSRACNIKMYNLKVKNKIL